MDEVALIPALQYVLLTALVVTWVVQTVKWLRFTVVTVALVALLPVFEGGLAYEGVKSAMR